MRNKQSSHGRQRFDPGAEAVAYTQEAMHTIWARRVEEIL